MIWIWIIIPFLFLWASAATFLALRFAMRTLQFDRLWDELNSELESYSSDLERMTRGDILTDHPEVLLFHKRNRRALVAINDALESSRGRRPKEPEVLPNPPVVE